MFIKLSYHAYLDAQIPYKSFTSEETTIIIAVSIIQQHFFRLKNRLQLNILFLMEKLIKLTNFLKILFTWCVMSSYCPLNALFTFMLKTVYFPAVELLFEIYLFIGNIKYQLLGY